MILLFDLDYRSSSQLYERLFLQTLREHKMTGCIDRNGFRLKLYVEAPTQSQLESFIHDFTASLPHSLFLYDTQAHIVEMMPERSDLLAPRTIKTLPFCPKCLSRVIEKDAPHYGDIFISCDACGYDTQGEQRNYIPDIEKIAEDIASGQPVKVNTLYGTYTIGIPTSICNDIDFDLLCYDLSTVERYANVTEDEIKALGSFEKPLIRLKSKLAFLKDHEEINRDMIRFKLPDDLLLHFLMDALHQKGIDTVFLTHTPMEALDYTYFCAPKYTSEPIEVVVSSAHIAIAKGEKGLPYVTPSDEEVNPATGALFSVIKEANIDEENIAGIYLSKRYKSRLLVYGKKYGIVPYLSFTFHAPSVEALFGRIRQSGETAQALLKNYASKFPEHYEYLRTIRFERTEHDIHALWGIVALILDYTKTSDLNVAGNTLEENALMFLGKRGPRIDYKSIKTGNTVTIDPLWVIRSAMSFRLAGVDPLMLSYGVIESFVEFLSNEFDTLKQTMGVSTVCAAGSLFENKHLFSKFSEDISKNHPLFFNNELPIDEFNIFYGGNRPEKRPETL